MVKRDIQQKLEFLATKYPFVLITGPRQSGKSTLARMTFPDYKYVSFSNFDDREFAKQDPKGFIKTYGNKVILDEVQLEPSILSYLQTYTDLQNKEGMYILTGSQNMLLMESVDQTLAGRVAILHLLPFSHKELQTFKIKDTDSEIFYGSYPRIFDKNIPPTDFYPHYINTYVERDLRNITHIGDISLFVKFLKLCAGRIGQLLNKASIATECGISEPTVQAWLSILEQSCIVHLLKPYYNNFSKRVVKSPKLYFYDTGLACSLLEIKAETQISSHFLRGGLFENMVVNNFIKESYNKGEDPVIYFWHDSNGNEVDLIQSVCGEPYAYEIKSGSTFNKLYFKGLDYWSKISGNEHTRNTVIYGGSQPLFTSNGNVLPW